MKLPGHDFFYKTILSRVGSVLVVRSTGKQSNVNDKINLFPIIYCELHMKVCPQFLIGI